MELPNTRTSALPKSKVLFTKDTLEGDFHGYRREIWSHAARSIKEGHGGNDGVQIFFALIKPDKEAVVFGVFTGWYHPQALVDWEERKISNMRPNPEGGAVEFHWAEPQWDGHTMDTDCTLIENGECYGNTGYTIGEAVFEALCIGGFDAVWECLYKFLREQEEQIDEE